jgi:hypothetical protein
MPWPLHAAPPAASRCTLGAGVPPRTPPPSAGAAPSQAERGTAPLSLGVAYDLFREFS